MARGRSPGTHQPETHGAHDLIDDALPMWPALLVVDRLTQYSSQKVGLLSQARLDDSISEAPKVYLAGIVLIMVPLFSAVTTSMFD